MIIRFRENSKTCYYDLRIKYNYLVNGKGLSVSFSDCGEFQTFMEECHPGISCDSVRKLFNKKYEELITLSHKPTYDEAKKFTMVYCCLCGDELYATTYETGIIEKMYSYKETSDKVNEGYIKTVLANDWSFKTENGIMSIKYWYDANSTADVCKIHIFDKKIILTRSNNKPDSVICVDKFYVHYEGNKKPQ